MKVKRTYSLVCFWLSFDVYNQSRGMSSVSSPVVKPNQDFKYEPMMGGTSLIQWDEYGYRLYSIDERLSERIIVFSFGKCCLNSGVSVTTYVRKIIYGEDRLLVVQSEDTDELKVSYISQNWPVLHVAASRDGMYLAVAGLHGLILHDIHLKRWRVFGDITQEQKIQCRGLWSAIMCTLPLCEKLTR